MARIRQTALILEQFPLLGYEGRVAGTREFKVTGLPYIIIYSVVTRSHLDILTVVHTSRDYPSR